MSPAFTYKSSGISLFTYKRYDDLPFYAYKSHQGKGHYLNIYYCERYYYPGGRKIEILAVKDIYKDRATKRYCSQDIENAYLYKAKGEVIGTRIIKFSNKTTFFRFKEYEFTKIWNEFRLWFMQLLHDLFDMPIEDGISFTQFVVHRLDKKYMPAARFWNSTFRRMNDFMNDAIQYLSTHGKLTDALNDKFSAIIESRLESIKNQKFERGNCKFIMSLCKEDSEYNKRTANIFYNAFANDIFDAVYK